MSLVIANDNKNINKLKISLISLGCDKNLVDSEMMLGIINEKNYTITSLYKTADVIIINTCGFITDAIKESIDNILKFSKYKKEGNCKALIVTGCMAQRYKEEIFNELPEVDGVVGTGSFNEISSIIEKVLKGEKILKISNINRLIDNKSILKRKISTPNHFAYLKISEGCDKKCTYCTIPSLKGKFRSRPIEDIIEEAKILASQNVKELIIVAQDTALYGSDIYKESKLHELLKKLSEIENIKWIRILYCYPEHITDKIIKEISSNKKICNYIDMPIQHCDNFILKKMARQSSNEKLKEVIKKLRNEIKDIAIRTTLIVGFPGETKEHFNNLVEFVKEMKFDKLGIFTYSREEGTPAYNMPNQVDEEEKNRRKDYLMNIQNEISKEKCEEKIGKILKVIVEGKLPEENIYCGRSYMDCYDIDGLVFFNSSYELLNGDFVNVRITHSSDYDLVGEVVNELT